MAELALGLMFGNMIGDGTIKVDVNVDGVDVAVPF
jgi:hypothetical protein